MTRNNIQIEAGDKRTDRDVSWLDYDGGGRRLAKHYDPKLNQPKGGGVDKQTQYVFDGLDPVAEYSMLNGQRTDFYRGAANRLLTMHSYKGGTQGNMYWYHHNFKGDVSGLTKHNGNSHHNYRYDPYGGVVPENGNFTDPHNHYTLTGKEYDENMGLVWFGARHYDPETGVWVSQDSYRGSLDEPMSLHRFGYVEGNPVSYLDLYGYAAGDPFSSPAEAASDFGMTYNDDSIRNNVEYFAAIYEVASSCDPTKTCCTTIYSYNIPNKGDGDSVSIDLTVELGQTVVSTVHAHANYDPAYDNNLTSPGDIATMVGTNPEYVTTPNGSLIEYDNSSSTVVRTNMPSSSDDPSRLNTVGVGWSWFGRYDDPYK